MKIFGREPTLWLEGLSALLTIAVAFWADALTQYQAGAIVAVAAALIGAINAWMVRPVAPAAFKLLVTTGAALLSTFGLDLSQEKIGVVQLGVVSVIALLTRSQVTPAADPLPIGSESLKTISDVAPTGGSSVRPLR